MDGLGDELDRLLMESDRQLADRYPGDRAQRQPVHTVYIPADRYDASTVPVWGAQAQEVLARHGGSPSQLAEACDLAPDSVGEVYERISNKLIQQPIEDLRIDFEDGYGNRPDSAEDADVIAAASALAESVKNGDAAPFHGIRFKSFEAATRRRGLRTLALFVGELARADGLTDGFVVTLPKVTAVQQVEAMAVACAAIENEHGLATGRLRFEIQVETPQSILGADGTVLVSQMIHAARGRCTALHYGTYDYSASCGIAAAYQSMEHPAADYAKAVMQVAAAGTGVHLSDGSTNVLPVGEESQVWKAWRLHARLVRRSLERGFYQGWDLHPAQLPTRYLATYAFYREGFATAAARLHGYVHGSVTGYLDEPATAAALAAFVIRGAECGAIDAAEIDRLVGIDSIELARLARRSPANSEGSAAGSA